MPLSLIPAASAGAIADALVRDGAVRIAALPAGLEAQPLLDEARALRTHGALRPAGTGRGALIDEQIRGDHTHWLEAGGDGPGAAYLEALQHLTYELREALRLPLHTVEAHYACYAPGAGYARHRDRLRASGSRLLSWVSYLNAQWQTSDGGALRLYLPDGTVDIPPSGGTSVCFLSELEHEVLPATRPRYSIAGWMRRDMA